MVMKEVDIIRKGTEEIKSFIERFEELKERRMFLECVDDLAYNILSTNPRITKMKLRNISQVIKMRIGIINGTMKRANTFGSAGMKSYKKAFYCVVGIPSRSAVVMDEKMYNILLKNKNLRKAWKKEKGEKK